MPGVRACELQGIHVFATARTAAAVGRNYSAQLLVRGLVAALATIQAQEALPAPESAPESEPAGPAPDESPAEKRRREKATEREAKAKAREQKKKEKEAKRREKEV